MYTAIFYTITTIMLALALYVVITRDIGRAVFCFFAVLFCLAGIYVFAFADFVAVTQVLVYVGGVVVLMIFALMLTEKKLLEDIREAETFRPKLFQMRGAPAVLLSVAVLVGLLYTIFVNDWDTLLWQKQAVETGNVISGTDNLVQNIGINMMSTYLLPFEIISIFLLVALIGAAYLARSRNIPE